MSDFPSESVFDRLRDAALPLLGSEEVEGLPPGLEIQERIGAGGMGSVWAAYDHRLQRRVAVKVLPASSGGARRLFLAEAKAAARLAHPNIATVFEAGEGYLVMRLVDGFTLKELRRRQSDMTAKRWASLVLVAAKAVAHAHERGVHHRDLKPSNVMVEGESNPQVFVVDFGLASIAGQGPGGGTPGFMAPEQREVVDDPRVDVHGLGATLLFGLAPRSIGELGPRLEDCEIGDPDLRQVLTRSLAPRAEERYASVTELVAELEAWLSDRPLQSTPTSLLRRGRLLLRRQRRLVRSVAITAAVVGLVVLAIALPLQLQQRARRESAERGAALAAEVERALGDAEAFRRGGRLERQRDTLDHALRSCERALDETEFPRGHLLRGRLLRARGLREEALNAFGRALAMRPKLLEARRYRGLAAASLALDDEVYLEAARSDLNAQPERDVLGALDRLMVRGYRAFFDADMDGAEAAFQQVLELDRLSVAALLSLSRIALERGDDERGRRYAVAAADLLRGFAPGYLSGVELSEAATLNLLPDGIEAIVFDFSVEAAMRSDDANSYGRRAQAALRRALGAGASDERELGWRQAKSELDAALAAASSPRPKLLSNRAVCWLELEQLARLDGRYAEALQARRAARRDFDAALEVDDSCSGARANRGLLSRREAMLAKAALSSSRASELEEAAAADWRRVLRDLPPGGVIQSRVQDWIEGLAHSAGRRD